MLNGKKVLVLEDESSLALNLSMMLDDIGCTVVGVARTMEAAMALALSSKIDAAVLDINIAGMHSVAVAEALRIRGIPFLLTTGHAPERAEKFGHTPILFKPYQQEDLAEALHALFSE